MARTRLALCIAALLLLDGGALVADPQVAPLDEALRPRLEQLTGALAALATGDESAREARMVWDNTVVDDVPILEHLLTAPAVAADAAQRDAVERRLTALRLVVAARGLSDPDETLRSERESLLRGAGIAAVPALAPILEAGDEAAAARAREILASCRYTLALEPTAAYVAWSDEVQVRVAGTTDLPDSTIVTTRIFAEHPPAPDGSARRSFVEQYLFRVEGGRVQGSMRGHRLAPGPYTFEYLIDGRRQYPQVTSLLMVDRDAGVAVGGELPSGRVPLTYGDAEDVRRERESGRSRVLNNVRRLEGLGETLFARLAALSDATPPAADAPTGPAADACRDLAQRLAGDDPIQRQRAREEVAALDSAAEEALLARARSGDADARTLATAIHWEWRQEVRRVRGFLNLASDNVLGRTPLPTPMHERYSESERQGFLLAHALLSLAAPVESVLPVPEPAAEPHAPGGETEPIQIPEGAPSTPELWREAYVRLAVAFAEDLTSDVLLRCERVRRELHAGYLEARSVPAADRARIWSETASRLGGEAERLAAEVASFAAPVDGASSFDTAVADGVRADPGIGSIVDGLRALLEAAGGAVGAPDEAPFDAAREAYLERLRRFAAARTAPEGEGGDRSVWRVPGPGDVWVDLERGEVRLPAQVCQRGVLIELFACTPGSKTHESALILPCQPSQLHAALLMLGLREGHPPHLHRGESVPRGDFVDIYVTWTDGGEEHTLRAEELVVNIHEETEMEHRSWVFTGSVFLSDVLPDGTVREVYGADANGIVITTFYRETALLHTSSQYGYDDTSFRTDPDRLPPEGTAVTLRIVPTPRADAERLRQRIEESDEAPIVTEEGGQGRQAPADPAPAGDGPADPPQETPR